MQVLLHPSDEMVLKCPFDQLMKEVRGDHGMNVCAREIGRERLVMAADINGRDQQMINIMELTTMSESIPYSSQSVPGSHVSIRSST